MPIMKAKVDSPIHEKDAPPMLVSVGFTFDPWTGRLYLDAFEEATRRGKLRVELDIGAFWQMKAFTVRLG